MLLFLKHSPLNVYFVHLVLVWVQGNEGEGTRKLSGSFQ